MPFARLKLLLVCTLIASTALFAVGVAIERSHSETPEVSQRLEDRTVGPRDGGPQLLRAEREARIDQAQGRPHVMRERVVQY